MSDPTITIVVATYNWPEPLRVALASALRQTREDWHLIVVGDGCDGRTADVIRDVDDARVRYVNLPVRFGEQSGPNSIGLRLATTPFVAFLNHDDAWLPDHLELGLAHLLTARADFFVGCAAFGSRPSEQSGGRPIFLRCNPSGRRAADAFYGATRLFEPCSTWIVRSDFARRIGDWRPAATLWRTPLVDWIARGWRLGGRFTFGETLTVLKMEPRVKTQAGEGYYGLPSPGHAYVADLLAASSASQVRQAVLDEIRRGSQAPRMTRREPDVLPARVLNRVLLNPLTAAAYRIFGVDGFAWYARCLGRRRGAFFEALTIRRTGRGLPPPPSVDEVIAGLRPSG